MAKEKIIRLLYIVKYVLLLVSYMIIIFMGIVSKYVFFKPTVFGGIIKKCSKAQASQPTNESKQPDCLPGESVYCTDGGAANINV